MVEFEGVNVERKEASAGSGRLFVEKRGEERGKAASTASEMASAKVGWGRTGRSSCSAVSSSVTAKASSEIRSVAR